jgi:hypothetical protein
MIIWCASLACLATPATLCQPRMKRGLVKSFARDYLTELGCFPAVLDRIVGGVHQKGVTMPVGINLAADRPGGKLPSTSAANHHRAVGRTQCQRTGVPRRQRARIQVASGQPAVRVKNKNTAAVKLPCNDRRKKVSSEKRSFCRTGCFQARHRWRVGKIEKPPACMQKPKIQGLAKRKMRSGQTGTCHGQWRLLSKTESLSI